MDTPNILRVHKSLYAALIAVMLSISGCDSQAAYAGSQDNSVLAGGDDKLISDAFWDYQYNHKKVPAEPGDTICLKELVDAGLLPEFFISDESQVKDAVISVSKDYKLDFYAGGCESLHSAGL